MTQEEFVKAITPTPDRPIPIDTQQAILILKARAKQAEAKLKEAEVMALEPKCGEWVKKTYTHEYANEETEERQYVVCGICGKQPPSGFGAVNFCHNCGADMRRESEEEG